MTRIPRGFTLVELVVSVAVFALVIMAVMTAYINLIKLDRQARSTNELVNNLSFAMDAMSRGIRTGTNYYCRDPNGSPDANGNSTNGQCTCFSYTDTNLNTTVTYHLEANHTIGRAIGTASCLDSASASISDPAITIAPCGAGVCGLTFYVRGAGAATNTVQPQVIFTVKGTLPASAGAATPSFVIEEDATQRVIDL